MTAQKNKRGPKPTGKGLQVVVRMHEPMIKAIDQWAEKFAPGEALSRPEIVRRMLTEYLRSCGLLK